MRMTEEQYRAHLARRKPINPKGEGNGVSREAELHAAILAECKRRGWIALHGRMDAATGRTVGEPDFTIVADPLAGRCRCCDSYHLLPDGWDGMGGCCGKSVNAIQRIFFIECKTAKGKLSAEQAAMIHWMGTKGVTVHVVRSMEQFMEVVK